jgi:hypothetical protein
VAKLKQIDIAQLRVGMFVADMDISWMQSPFLRHRCLLKTENDVRLLKLPGPEKSPLMSVEVQMSALHPLWTTKFPKPPPHSEHLRQHLKNL